MNETSIDWKNPREGWHLTHSWNPVVGCQNNCFYCYARSSHNKRHELKLAGKKLPNQYLLPFSKIQLFNNRIKLPLNIKKNCNVFVGSVADIFNKKVPDSFIRKIIETCEECNPRHRFLFCTQHPERYADFTFPLNCYLGTTIKDKSQSGRLESLSNKTNKTFVSIEPISSDFRYIDFSYIDTLFVGPMTKVSEENMIKPKIEWLESIIHNNIHFKKEMLLFFPDIKDICF